jgi:hypothetical protein
VRDRPRAVNPRSTRRPRRRSAQTGHIVLHDAAADLRRSDLVRKTYLGEK